MAAASDKSREYRAISDRYFGHYYDSETMQTELKRISAECLDVRRRGKQGSEATFRELDALMAERHRIFASPPGIKSLSVVEPYSQLGAAGVKTVPPTSLQPYARASHDSAALSFVTPEDHTNSATRVVGSKLAFGQEAGAFNIHPFFDSALAGDMVTVREPSTVAVRFTLTPVVTQAHASLFPAVGDNYYCTIFESHTAFAIFRTPTEHFVFAQVRANLHTAMWWIERLNGGTATNVTPPTWVAEPITLQAELGVDPGSGTTDVCVSVGVRHIVDVTDQHVKIDVVSVGDWKVDPLTTVVYQPVIH